MLLDDAEVALLTGSRVYRHGSAPKTVAAPYVTWFVVSAAPENELADLPAIDAYTVQVDCWSANDGTGDTGVETLAEAVRNALEDEAYLIGLDSNLRDPDTLRYRASLQFTFWVDRPVLSSGP